MHAGCAGAPHEVRSFTTDFHRSRLELAESSVRETRIILPARERNEQVWSTPNHSLVKPENKYGLGLEVMGLITEIVRDPGSQ